MTLAELYPYLSDTHEELLDSLAMLSDPQWNRKPCPPSSASIRQVVARAVERERQLVLEIAQGRRAGSSVLELTGLSNEDLLSELSAARVVTERYVATLAPEMLRSVRAVAADVERNIPECNMPLGWALWSVVENEIAAAAAVRLLLTLSDTL